MNKKTKNQVIITFFVMAISGLITLILDKFFPLETAYGLRANPYIDEFKLIHNLSNFLFIFCVGMIYPGHIHLGLTGIKKKRRKTGILIFSSIVILFISGCVLLYSSNDLVETIHWVCGLILCPLAIYHLFLRKA